MNAQTFTRSLTAFCKRRPFRSFIVEFKTGERLKIVHPEILVIEEGNIVRFSKGRNHRLFDAIKVTQLMDIEDE